MTRPFPCGLPGRGFPHELPATAPENQVDAATLDWVGRVAQNGGTVSPATTAAVDAFVRGCKVDGTWSLIDHINLLCGDQLSAARVALKVGSGNSVFPLTAFVSGDYTEGAGLTSSVSTKYVDTGMQVNVPTGGFGFYLRSTISAASTRRPIGSSDGTTVYNATQGTTPNYQGVYGVAGGATSTAGTLPLGWNHIDRSAANRLDLYSNGASTFVHTTSATTAANGQSCWVFGMNQSGAISGHSPCTIGAYGLFQTMTAGQAMLLATRIEAFQDNFVRGVV
jgi:hypothetical protein